MVPRKSNHPWRIRLIVMVTLAASVGLVEAIQASIVGTAGQAPAGKAVLVSNYSNAGSSTLNPGQIAIDSTGLSLAASRAAVADYEPSPIAGK
jgi:hypothetical protein